MSRSALVPRWYVPPFLRVASGHYFSKLGHLTLLSLSLSLSPVKYATMSKRGQTYVIPKANIRLDFPFCTTPWTPPTPPLPQTMSAESNGAGEVGLPPLHFHKSRTLDLPIPQCGAVYFFYFVHHQAKADQMLVEVNQTRTVPRPSRQDQREVRSQPRRVVCVCTTHTARARVRKLQWLSSLLAFESEIKKELVALDNGTWQSISSKRLSGVFGLIACGVRRGGPGRYRGGGVHAHTHA